MRARSGFVFFSLCLAVAVRGAEPEAMPLANTARELKTLAGDRAAGKNTANEGGLRVEVPRLQVPDAGSDENLPIVRPPTAQSEAALKRKQAAQKNWLVDGVNKLARSDDVRGSDELPDVNPVDQTVETGAVDTSDPNYMLNAYSKQKKTDQEKETKQSTGANREDPFAPFLQNWLGNSPVRGKFYDELLQPADRTQPAVGNSGPAVVTVTNDNSSVGYIRPLPGTDRAASPSNPYLSGLDQTGMQTLTGSPIRVTDLPPISSPVRVTEPGQGNLPAAKADESKPRLPLQTDDEKYFPQLRRF